MKTFLLGLLFVTSNIYSALPQELVRGFLTAFNTVVTTAQENQTYLDGISDFIKQCHRRDDKRHQYAQIVRRFGLIDTHNRIPSYIKAIIARNYKVVNDCIIARTWKKYCY